MSFGNEELEVTIVAIYFMTITSHYLHVYGIYRILSDVIYISYKWSVMGEGYFMSINRVFGPFLHSPTYLSSFVCYPSLYIT